MVASVYLPSARPRLVVATSGPEKTEVQPPRGRSERWLPQRWGAAGSRPKTVREFWYRLFAQKDWADRAGLVVVASGERAALV